MLHNIHVSFHSFLLGQDNFYLTVINNNFKKKFLQTATATQSLALFR